MVVSGRTANTPYEIQKPATGYFEPQYLKPERMSSIGYQYELAIASGGQTFLNIGPGSGILEYLLEKNDKLCLTIDIDPLLAPSIVAGLPFLPLRDKAVDVVLAFQVLEHLPYSMVYDCLKEIARISKQSIIISLPDCSAIDPIDNLKRENSGALNPRSWFRKKADVIPQTPYIDPEHFWEMGFADIQAEDIERIATSVDLRLVKRFRNRFFYYHHFFVLEICAVD